MTTNIQVAEDGTVTVVTPQATITVQANCPAEPAEFEPNTAWPVDASSSLRFSFVAGTMNESIGFGYDAGGYFGTVNEFPDGVSEAGGLFTLHYRTDLDRSYVTLHPVPEAGTGRAARVTVTDAVTGESQTFLGISYGSEFQVQTDSTLELVDGDLYYVEFAVADGGG